MNSIAPRTAFIPGRRAHGLFPRAIRRADMKRLQVMIGHASIAVAAHTYADLYDSDLDRVADAMDAPSE